MANAKLLFPFIMEWEGGFVDDPADAGGATNMGVTLSTYRSYCLNRGLSQPTVDDLKAIPIDHVFDIFKKMYWDRWRADDINDQKVANMLVDWVWGSGIYGITYPQRVLGVVVDGVVGNQTISAVNEANPDDLLVALFQSRSSYLVRIVRSSVIRYERKIGRKATHEELIANTNHRFYNGWLNRLNSLLML